MTLSEEYSASDLPTRPVKTEICVLYGNGKEFGPGTTFLMSGSRRAYTAC